MFKVICINNGPMKNNEGAIVTAPMLKEGKVYSVIEVDIDNDLYVLSSIDPEDGFYGFITRRFIPLSEIDETELVNQREELQTA